MGRKLHQGPPTAQHRGTWRLGPEPAYLTVFYTPDEDLKRIRAWEEIFTSHEVSFLEASGKLSARVERAGCYTTLLEPIQGNSGRFYVEYFTTAEDASTEDVRDHFRDRQGALGEVTLHLAATRIGMLAPPPGGLAVWSVGQYADLARLATRSRHDTAIQVQDAGVYATVGDEVL